MRYIISCFCLFFSTQVASNIEDKSICGRQDDRTFSYDTKIGKAVKIANSRIGCTVTMIDKSCAITAGHCLEHLKFVEFNIQHPNSDGSYPTYNSKNLYPVIESSIKYKNINYLDWAVIKLLPNSETGLLPGVVQGYYDVSSKKPRKRERVFITGYGIDNLYSDIMPLQKTHNAKLRKISLLHHTLTHFVDTKPGNSGSAIIHEESNKIIGIHTNGGCDDREKDNLGTLIYNNFELNLAIKNCISN